MNKLLNALKYLLEQVDEDCPVEYRTKHLIEAMQDAQQLIEEIENANNR